MIEKPPAAPVDMVVIGATGDLARRKLFPALYAASRHLALHITGKDKWSVYRRAATGNASALPVQALIERAGERLELYWAP